MGDVPTLPSLPHRQQPKRPKRFISCGCLNSHPWHPLVLPFRATKFFSPFLMPGLRLQLVLLRMTREAGKSLYQEATWPLLLMFYFWPRWVLVATYGPSLVAANRSCSSWWCVVSAQWLLLLHAWTLGTQAAGAVARRLSDPKACRMFWSRDWTRVPCIGRWIPYHWTTGEAPHNPSFKRNFQEEQEVINQLLRSRAFECALVKTNFFFHH